MSHCDAKSQDKTTQRFKVPLSTSMVQSGADVAGFARQRPKPRWKSRCSHHPSVPESPCFEKISLIPSLEFPLCALSGTMICGNCQKTSSLGSLFCPHCGAELENPGKPWLWIGAVLLLVLLWKVLFKSPSGGFLPTSSTPAPASRNSAPPK